MNLLVSQGVVALDGDRVVGTALCSDLGPVATINMVIVDAAMRGRGLGRQLVTGAMAFSGSPEIRLIATKDGQPLYEKLGFVACGTALQHQGIARALTPGQPVTMSDGHARLPELIAQDRLATGMDRAPVLRRITQRGRVLDTAGGMAVLRRFGRGHLLGPVLAQSEQAAAALICAAASHLRGRVLRLDLPDGGLADLAVTLGLARVDSCITMRLNPGPTRDGDGWRVFGLLSQALG